VHPGFAVEVRKIWKMEWVEQAWEDEKQTSGHFFGGGGGGDFGDDPRSGTEVSWYVSYYENG